MEERTSKIFVGLCMLVLVWIGVYWMWEPGEPARPRISIANEQPPKLEPEPEPSQPVITHPPVVEPPVVTPSDPEPNNISHLITPQFRMHTVQHDEVMQDIAKHYYNRSSLWTSIARANPTVDPLKLKVGMQLRIPLDPANIQGLVENDDTLPPLPPGVIRPTQPTTNPVVDYIVQHGDSLSLIAQRYYGSSRHANFIFESNRNTLRSMDAIREGQTLKLPPLDPKTDP